MILPAYAGIGSRETPPEALQLMFSIGEAMAREGWLLRSGAADGADAAFERGCNLGKGEKEIFLPWPRFNGHTSELASPPQKARDIAARYHPVWDRLSEPVKLLMARNVQQVLGVSLDSPSRMVVCWTPKGAPIGGTGQALRIAMDHQIPIVNLFGRSLKQIQEQINAIVEENQHAEV